MAVPFTRRLPYVLSRAFARGASTRCTIGKVAAIPNSKSVQVDFDGVLVTVPKLASYAPTVGEPVYLLVADTLVLALGTVK